MSPRVAQRLRKPAEEDVRTRTLRVATKLIAERGFDGTSLQDVADEVGVAKPSLLYHFPSKQALRSAVFEQMLGHWNVALPRILRAATSGEDQFEGVLGEMVRFFSEDRDRATLLLREVLDRPREMAGVIKRHMKPWLDSVAGYIKKGQAHGDLHDDVDAEAYVIHVTTFLISTIAVQRLLAPLPDAKSVRELVRIARASLFVPAAKKPRRKT
jgi:AcrR family transcriptional regulator